MQPETLISVVVPLFNEEKCVLPLVREVRDALDGERDWELILVDDGSRDATVERARAAASGDPRVRVVQLARNYGQTTAMQAGFDRARGRVVVSMDGDLQNDPRDIPRLIDKLEEGYDLVTGYRKERQDGLLTRKAPSWVANRIIRWTTGVPIRDNGCTLKAYRAEILSDLHLYSELHRFIPAVAAATSGARITEIPVRHHPRRFGVSKYGLGRTWRVLLDLLTVTMIRWFRQRPLVMFGWGAGLAAVIGTAFFLSTLVAVATFAADKASAVVLPGVAILSFGLAIYLLMLGLIGEVAVHWERRHGADGSSREDVAWPR